MTHPWIGAGGDDRRRILDELDLDSAEELFAAIPAEVRTDGLNLAAGLDETAVIDAMQEMAGLNVRLGDRPSFLGAGVYRHVRPSIVDAVISRSEFLTSYTPYQPEFSQGTLQAIFEFQTLMCQLTGLEVANASLYDGATALVEAALMAHRVLRGKRNKVVVAETVHPLYRQVLGTYAGALGVEVVTVPPGLAGRLDEEDLAEALAADACCVAVQSPNFLGVVEDLGAVASAASGVGALAVHVVAEAASLGVLLGGGAHGCDVVCGEAQSFGLPPGLGGPHLGFLACRRQHIRQMPGRLAGQTEDVDGRRAFCLTLSTREQHIRRAKATSNICTNHGLMALAATVWLESLGGRGLQELSRSCLSTAAELARRIEEVGGEWRLAYPSSPVFNEFLLLGPGTGAELAARLEQEGVLAGVPAHKWGGSWPDGLVVAVTERTSASDVDALVQAIGRLM